MTHSCGVPSHKLFSAYFKVYLLFTHSKRDTAGEYGRKTDSKYIASFLTFCFILKRPLINKNAQNFIYHSYSSFIFIYHLSCLNVRFHFVDKKVKKQSFERGFKTQINQAGNLILNNQSKQTFNNNKKVQCKKIWCLHLPCLDLSIFSRVGAKNLRGLYLACEPHFGLP